MASAARSILERPAVFPVHFLMPSNLPKEKTMKKVLLTAVAVAAATLAGSAAADTVKISGASIVFSAIVSPAKGAVEKSTGHTLELFSSNASKGLNDLLVGATDIAMVSVTMDVAAEAAAEGGKKIDIKDFQFFELKKDEIVFVVNQSNPVGKLTWEQLTGIYSGKITNWKTVGGKDLPIVVYTDALAGATRATIRKHVMGGTEMGPGVKAQSSLKRSAEMVGSDEGGIAGIGKGFIDKAKMKAIQSKKLETPLALVTLGAPKPAVKAVIDAFAKEAKSH